MKSDDVDRRAKGIIDRETQFMNELTRGLVKELDSPKSALSAFCHLMNTRQRYFGQTGEVFSVQDLTGINLVDHMDELLLVHLKKVLERYRQDTQKSARTEAVQFLSEKCAKRIKDIPQYPVGYMVLFVIRNVFETFDEVLNDRRGYEEEDLEEALLSFLDSIIDRYVKTRHTPVLRHFSDVAREYSAVSRLKCPCGVEKYEVKKQALLTDPKGNPYDRLDLSCGDCGNECSIQFYLPHFKDIAVM